MWCKSGVDHEMMDEMPIKREDAGSPLTQRPARIMKKLILKYEILNVDVCVSLFSSMILVYEIPVKKKC